MLKHSVGTFLPGWGFCAFLPPRVIQINLPQPQESFRTYSNIFMTLTLLIIDADFPKMAQWLLCGRGIILDLRRFCGITKGWLTQLHVSLHTHLKMVLNDDFFLFTVEKRCQNEPCKPLFYWSHQSFLTWCDWNAWRQTVCALTAVGMPVLFLLHRLCVAASMENSPRCCVTILLPNNLALLSTAPQVREHVWNSASFRPFQDSHKCILFDLTCMPTGWTFSSRRQLASKSWSVTHIEHVFWQLLLFFPNGTLPETKVNRSNSSDTPIHITCRAINRVLIVQYCSGCTSAASVGYACVNLSCRCRLFLVL